MLPSGGAVAERLGGSAAEYDWSSIWANAETPPPALWATSPRGPEDLEPSA
jgi:hypothetical protein